MKDSVKPTGGVKLAENETLSAAKFRFGVYLVSMRGGYKREMREEDRQKDNDGISLYISYLQAMYQEDNNLG